LEKLWLFGTMKGVIRPLAIDGPAELMVGCCCWKEMKIENKCDEEKQSEQRAFDKTWICDESINEIFFFVG
jgi:hypothetical protein